MDLIDLEDDTIDAKVMDSLAVTMDNLRVREITMNTVRARTHTHTHTHTHKHSHMRIDTLVCLFKVPQIYFLSSM